MIVADASALVEVLLRLPFQRRADIGGMSGGGGVERQHLQPRREMLHFSTAMLWATRLLRAMQQFGQDNRGDTQAVGLQIEPFAQGGGTIAQHPDAKVGVEHIAQHQKASRAWASERSEAWFFCAGDHVGGS